jgi:Mor transcription activator family
MQDNRSIEIADLPPLIADFAETLGMDAAMLIVQHYSNQRMSIPLRRKNDRMVELLGDDLTRKLMATYGGCQWVVPLCAKLVRKQRNTQMLADYQQGGLSVPGMAKKYGLSYRQTSEILAGRSNSALSDSSSHQ